MTVRIYSARPVNTFRPNEALGAGVDGMERGDVGRVYTPANIAAMRSAGFKPLTYRLRTELGVEAWHWNPRGAFSDAANRQGYWTSDASPGQQIQVSNGYQLPRRGSTVDQANDSGYSRIDDGDVRSFWKSNPYLDRHFTHEDNALHPQWVLADLRRRQPIDAIRILWGAPHAREYRVEYWRGQDPPDPQDLPKHGGWAPFPLGNVTDGGGGDDLRRLAARPIQARWVRLVMTKSAAIPSGGADLRDGVGYAIRELYLGTMLPGGELRDRIAHARRSREQTRLYASSTDPWHTAGDMDRNVEQPGLDLIYRSGLTNRLPVLMPVGLLYDTPENAAAQVRWLEARGYPLKQIEMGEEPDGQYITPEDYGALYIQWADAIHAVDPRLKLGGPGFQPMINGWQAWPDSRGITSWFSRFLGYLKARGRIQDFSFFSFEWYPFDLIGVPTAPQLAAAPRMLQNAIAKLRRQGLSPDIPWIISEYGYSSFAGEAEVDLPGALLNAEIACQFLTLGGDAAYLYGYEPNMLIRETPKTETWGNMALFLTGPDRVIRCPLPIYHGAVLLTQRWAEPGNGLHQLFRAEADLQNGKGQPLITAYAVRGPDGRWAVMLLNKDPARTHRVRIRFEPDGQASTLPAWRQRAEARRGKPQTVPGNDGSGSFADAEMWQYGPAQYAWHSAGANGFPLRNGPAEHRPAVDGANGVILPPYSMTVLRTGRAR